ncbi:MAG: hypothetical protein HY806_01915 [Nitrospirae bacterium]|nr:hypothetical protein [Nitrospirota bacterium]
MIVQGDVFFIRTQSIPEGALQKSREAKGYVIAKGEATGHAHVIEDEAMLYDKKGTLFVKVSKPVEVRHE